MAQPATKRQETSHVKASKIADSEWKRHKSTLTDLYVNQKKTVREIHQFMLDNHEFPANEQQYQKRFTYWNLTKNVSSDDWLALSQQLKRCGITLDYIDPQHGSVDITFSGQVRAFGTVKKAIYRNDTCLLKVSRPDCLSPVQKLQKMLRNIIARCIIKDEDNLLRSRMPQDLISLLFTIPDPGELSSYLANRHKWALKKRSDGLMITFPTDEEQGVFVACIESLSHEKADTASFRNLNSDEINHYWTKFRRQNLRRASASRRNSLDAPSSDPKTQILMVTLSYCIMLGPKSTLSVLPFAELVKLSGLLPTGLSTLYDELLEILLIASVTHRETAYCEQLIAINVDLNAIRPWSLRRGFPFIASTALQVSLESDFSSGLEPEHAIFMMLLRAGADPTLCGLHGRTEFHDPLCCESSPLSRALRHPSNFLRALLDFWPYSLHKIDLTTTILRNKDLELGTLLVLLEKGISPEGGFPSPTGWWCLCPLQAALGQGRKQIALRLLDSIESGLGCSTRRPQDILDAFNEHKISGNGFQSHDFRTPLTHAVNNHFFDIADELLKKGADLNMSYMDYLSPDGLRQLEGKRDRDFWKDYIYLTSAGPLQVAAWREDTAAILFLLNAGADPNCPHPVGLSPLAIAVTSPNEVIAELLLDHGAFVFLEDLHILVQITRRMKEYFKRWSIRKMECADRLIHALEEVIRELEPEQNRGETDPSVKRLYHMTVAQCRTLQQDFDAWLLRIPIIEPSIL